LTRREFRANRLLLGLAQGTRFGMNRTITRWESGLLPIPKVAGWAMKGLLAEGVRPLQAQGGVVNQSWETVKVTGDNLIKRVKELVHEGNVRRVIIKQGANTIAEFPVTIGVVGAVAAPMLAALGAVAALLADCSICCSAGPVSGRA
jgi:hypothetical protein